MYPAVIQGARVLGPAAMKRMGQVFDKITPRASKDVIDVVEKSTGIKGAFNKAVKVVKDNPITSAIVAYELAQLAEGAIDAPVKAELKAALADLIDANPDVKRMAEAYGWKADPVETSDIVRTMQQAEEMRAISEASALLRGKENLLTLRRALSLPDATYILHDAQLSMKANVY